MEVPTDRRAGGPSSHGPPCQRTVGEAAPAGQRKESASESENQNGSEHRPGKSRKAGLPPGVRGIRAAKGKRCWHRENERRGHAQRAPTTCGLRIESREDW